MNNTEHKRIVKLGNKAIAEYRELISSCTIDVRNDKVWGLYNPFNLGRLGLWINGCLSELETDATLYDKLLTIQDECFIADTMRAYMKEKADETIKFIQVHGYAQVERWGVIVPSSPVELVCLDERMYSPAFTGCFDTHEEFNNFTKAFNLFSKQEGNWQAYGDMVKVTVGGLQSWVDDFKALDKLLTDVSRTPSTAGMLAAYVSWSIANYKPPASQLREKLFNKKLN